MGFSKCNEGFLWRESHLKYSVLTIHARRILTIDMSSSTADVSVVVHVPNFYDGLILRGIPVGLCRLQVAVADSSRLCISSE